MRSVLLSLVLAMLVPIAPAAAQPATARPAATPTATKSSPPGPGRKAPKLKVRTVVSQLDHPWDVRSLPGGALLFTQRDRATLSVFRKGHVRRVKFPSSSVWVSGETGLMGLEVDPGFTKNRRIYTCQGGFTGNGGHDVHVTAWTLDKRLKRAKLDRELVGGFPTTSGRHGGCRLIVTSDGSLLVGTGDAATGTNPEDLDSLGGKTLRLDRFTGAPWPANPFVNQDGPRRYVHTYGHRNVQGVTERADGTLWSIEQGTNRDDEVNRLVNGGDYGYNPVPGYNESVPMTDQSLPGHQVRARWSSGNPTLATSGGSFVDGKKWGSLDGALAVACLKASRVVFLTFNAKGKLRKARTPAVLQQYGRIRQVVQSANGDLLVTTDNGGGQDKILRVTPR
ncbi:MAG TPA: PQQ-dependent sugar dehydrogenase [Nocardioides sp.]|uniref:PQQ-dependent sugar dehydrogenase n=1 Tax=uncultured Nocardioides sp. TaxID=198441 RepID=UPI000ED2D7EA|nr:PQQ-dependent sugar dehydrogenase [uncultured Nocardioides sp.]HCB05540.1 glucose sorbosone dehydrogenase [Nocardioides sp.]HRI94599.1 PQQ-dependent sugar dehydrogenase [Nocardioides sp.]